MELIDLISEQSSLWDFFFFQCLYCKCIRHHHHCIDHCILELVSTEALAPLPQLPSSTFMSHPLCISSYKYCFDTFRFCIYKAKMFYLKTNSSIPVKKSSNDYIQRGYDMLEKRFVAVYDGFGELNSFNHATKNIQPCQPKMLDKACYFSGFCLSNV